MNPPQRYAQIPVGLPPTLAENLPFTTIPLTIGERVWQITAVENQDALLNIAEQLTHIPYGFLLWESAVALSQQLVTMRAQVANARVLELGAGVGLAGLVARTLGAEVWQTDHEPNVLLVAAQNARQNELHGVQQFVADWRTWNHTAQYDLILGADILYERAMYPYLEPIFLQNLAPHGQLLLTDPSRSQALPFLAELESRGWHFEIEMHTIAALTPSVRKATANGVEVAILTGTR